MPRIKTKCMFCSMQDSFFLEEKPRSEGATFARESQLWLEYDPEQVRGLCGRGNFCQELSVHPKRIFRARIGLDYAPIGKVARDFAESLEDIDGEKVAILLDGALTLEEVSKALALAEKIGTKLVAFLPAEDLAVVPFENSFNFDSIAESPANVLIGDAFTNSPTVTRLVHDAAAMDRKHTAIGIDNTPSRTGWFSHPELVTSPGRVPELIALLAEAVGGKSTDDMPLKELGVSPGDFGWAVSAIKDAGEKGNIIVSPAWHFVDAFAVCGAAKKLAEAVGAGFCVLPISTGTRGAYRLLDAAGCEMAKTYSAVVGGEVDAILALDCDPVEAFPQAPMPELFGISAQLPTDGTKKASHTFPASYMFEKQGTLLGTEEDMVEIGGDIEGPGVKPAGEIIDLIYGGKAPQALDIEKAGEPREKIESPVKGGSVPGGDYIGIGQGDVMHHADGRYTRRLDFIRLRTEENIHSVQLHPDTAAGISAAEGDELQIKSDFGKISLRAKYADWLKPGAALLPMQNPEARKLFDPGGKPALGPIEITISKA